MRNCPFCGSDDTEVIKIVGSKPFIVCNECGATRGPTHWRGGMFKAVVAWDHRVPDWISVEDRLPNTNGWYLTLEWYPDNELLPRVQDYFSETRWWGPSGTVQPTHWMPLPSPPEAIETEEEWPDCAVQGCNNKRCDVVGSPFCYPHTTEKLIVKVSLEAK